MALRIENTMYELATFLTEEGTLQPCNAAFLIDIARVPLRKVLLEEVRLGICTLFGIYTLKPLWTLGHDYGGLPHVRNFAYIGRLHATIY